MVRSLTVCALVASACGSSGPSSPDVALAQSRAPLNIPHAFELASKMPPHLAVMFSMSWFGIPASDPQGEGPDPSYGNTLWNGACVTANDPKQCGACVLSGANDTCLTTGSAQRQMASRRRPLAGIYSASGKDTEGDGRIDLMLSTLRRPCDDGARLGAWTLQLNGTRDTAAHPANPSCTTCEIAYGATVGFFSRADAAGMTNVIIPGDDATWYFHFGGGVGLGACDDSPNNPKQNCIDALTQDTVDMVQLAGAHPSAVRIAGKLVVFYYVDPGYLSAAQWSTLLQNARNAVGQDFYAFATLQNPTRTDYFTAFDALAPWIQLDWANSSGATVRAHAAAWAAGEHDALFAALGANPGRVALGGVTPGFDDFTMNWGACQERQLPPGDPRDPAVLQGEFDYLAGRSAKGLIFETWDDWTEGSEFEPDVEGGPSVLVALRGELGGLFGDPVDPVGDARLAARWNGYGQARNCDGAAAGTPPVIELICADAGTDTGLDGGVDGGTDAGASGKDGGTAASDAGRPDAAAVDAGPSPVATGHGCGCAGSGAFGPGLLSLFFLACVSRSRRGSAVRLCRW
jgi:hypothetical protein